ncbi:MAG: hypothetical protein JOY69_04095, partial [Candidatus Eremiobacteraeota bacterium]|nr:hypothetical protein [Candidatus Eremiobacteraeota bacterium]
MYGFDLVYPHEPLFPYHFVDRKQTSQYWKLARQYALADHMFSTSISNSGFVAQLYLLTARSEVRSNVYVADHPSQMPWGCDAPAGTTTPIYTRRGIRHDGPYPCFAWNSLPAELDAGAISWRYYLPSDELGSNAIDAVKDIRNGKDWSSNVVTPQTRILSDIQSGTLPHVAWVYPDQRDSDDPGTGSGSKWVATVVGALRNSQYWQNSAVLITWEASDYFYDNVAPPRYDLAELGFRVPLIAVSPYAKQGYVSHDEHEFGSILHFIEVVLGLPSLGATDERADSLSDMFTL